MNEKTNEKEKLPWGLKEVAPGSLKSLSKKDLEDFEYGTFNKKKKHFSKKEQEEIRKKKEDEAAAQILNEFVASFDDNKNKNKPKIFIKGSIINPSTKEEKITSDTGNIYTPAFKMISTSKNNVKSPLNKFGTQEVFIKDTDELSDMSQNQKLNKKSKNIKRKSNLELFKEELKKIQMEREEKSKSQSSNQKSEPEFVDKNCKYAHKSEIEMKDESVISEDTSNINSNINKIDDPNTTNIFISNLSPKTVEQDLIHKFGKYGLLASVKIMWPRNEDKIRNANCGFVAFMSRKDAEIALKELDGNLENGFIMRLSWSKAISLPSKPFYIPPELHDVLVPPPPTGLPYNAQPQKIRSKSRINTKVELKELSGNELKKADYMYFNKKQDQNCSNVFINSTELEKTLSNSIVKVVIPIDRTILILIHRTIEFVIKEGPAFEAMIMANEINNNQYRFLFDNQCPAHIYYRWKLFSLMNGDSTFDWKTEAFQMFKDSSFWYPPILNKFTRGYSDEDYNNIKQQINYKNGISKSNNIFNNLMKNLTVERISISKAMVYCIDNADRAELIVELFEKFYSNYDCNLNQSIAGIYLISDILHNCIVKVSNASYYRKGFEKILPNIFDNLNKIYKKIDGKMKSESFKQKILNCIRAWEDWAIYANDFLVKLQNKFLGLLTFNQLDEYKKTETITNIEEQTNQNKTFNNSLDENIDGSPFKTDDVDTDMNCELIKSKFKILDTEKETIITSKWDFYEDHNDSNSKDHKTIEKKSCDNIEDEDIDGKPLDDENYFDSNKIYENEEKRKKLRNIELIVEKYIDDLENENSLRIENLTIEQQASLYRDDLIKKEFWLENSSHIIQKFENKNKKRSSSSSSSSTSYKKKSKKAKNKK